MTGRGVAAVRGAPRAQHPLSSALSAHTPASSVAPGAGRGARGDQPAAGSLSRTESQRDKGKRALVP